MEGMILSRLGVTGLTNAPFGDVAACMPIRACMIGDSITAGSTASGKQSYGGMMDRVAFVSDGRLINWYYPETATKLNAWESLGVSGLTVDGFQTQSYRWQSIKQKSQLVFYWLGHNDMPSSGSSLTTVQRNTLRNKVRADVEVLASSGAVVVPVPLMPTTSKDRAETILHNAWLAEYCAGTGLVLGPDLFTVMDGNQGTYCHDGTHPNDTGYLHLQRAWKSWLDTYIPRKGFGWHPLGSSTASQTGAVLNYYGSMTTAGLGTAGYGGTPGTFTSQVLNAEDLGLASNALEITKTGGQSMYVINKSVGGVTGYTAGDLVLFHMRVKAENMIAGDSMLQTQFGASTGHGGAYMPFYGGYESDGEWGTLLCAYQVPATTTNLNFVMYFRPQTTASTATTGKVTIAEPCLVNLTTMQMTSLWQSV